MKRTIPDNKITAAAVLVISSDNKILAFARGGNKNKLGLPAGVREKGETIIECAKRELFEETGFVLELNNTERVFIYKPDDKQKSGTDGYCATFVKQINKLSSDIKVMEANKDDFGTAEGFGLWVNPEDFISKGNSAFFDYNTKLLKFSNLLCEC